MRKSLKSTSAAVDFSIDRTIAARYAPVPAMIDELLSRIEPDGYAVMVREFSEEYQPVGDEVRLVEHVAHIAIHMRGCFYLETDILRRGMESGGPPNETPGDAQFRAWVADMEGPKLIDKASRYNARLQKEFIRSTRLLRQRTDNRMRTNDAAAATLLNSKTCTSVIQ